MLPGHLMIVRLGHLRICSFTSATAIGYGKMRSYKDMFFYLCYCPLIYLPSVVKFYMNEEDCIFVYVTLVIVDDELRRT